MTLTESATGSPSRTMPKTQSLKTRLCRIQAEAFRRRERLTVDQWADRFRYLIPEAAAEPGRWRTDKTPYLREIMRVFTDPRISEITLACASQVGKTEAINNCLGWIADQNPAPTQFILPNEDLAADYNTDRLIPTIEATPRLRARLANSAGNRRGSRGKGGDTKRLKVVFDRMTLWFGGSNSNAKVKNRPCRDRFADEIDADEFEQAAIGHLRQRADAWPGGKLVKASIPSLKGRGIDAEYQKSDRRAYWIPCPHCGTFQVWRWSLVHWDGGGRASPEQAERTTFCVCAECERAAKNRHGEAWLDHAPRIYEHHKREMLAAGVWVQDGREVIRNGPDGLVLGPEIPSRHAGFWLSQLYSPFKTWGAIAAEWVGYKGQPPREFINGVLAEAWAPKGEATSPSQLRSLAIPKDHPGAYVLGTVPPGVLALIGTIDLQADRAYLVVRGYGEAGQRTWLVWCEELECRAGRKLAELDRLRRWAFPSVDADGKPTGVNVMPSAWGIDSGHRTVEVYDWVRRMHALNPSRPVMAIKGIGTGGAGIAPYVIKTISEYPDGRAMPGGVYLFEPASDMWKTAVFDKIGGALAECEEARADKRNPDHGWVYPHDVPDEYLEHMTAEQRVDPSVRADGKARPNAARTAGRLVWMKRPGRERNDYWDAEYYNAAMSQWAGVVSLTKAATTPAEILAGDRTRQPTEQPRPARRGFALRRR